MIKSIFIVLVILLASCAFELNRKNPLDPQGNGAEAPEKVIVEELPTSSVGSIQISWILQEDADQFRIYRSLSYNGNYLLTGTVTGDESSYEDIGGDLISGTWYYYKVSAVNEDGLEGYRSEPVYTYFINESSE